MRGVRQLFRSAGPIVLIALLLVPVVVSGHHHAGRTQGPCAACVATHHTPAVGAPAVIAPETAPLVVGFDAPSPAVPTASEGRRATGRGPPVLLHIEEA